MPTLIQTKVSEARKKARIWTEGLRLAKEGLRPGMKLRMREHAGRLILTPVEDNASGEGIVTVSRRTRRGSVYPLLEVRGDTLLRLFGLATRVVIKIFKGKVSISRHHQDERIEERNAEFKERIEAGEELRVASLYHGGGVMDSAIHDGLAMEGVKSYCNIMSEIESAYVESSLSNNPHLFRDSSLILNAPVDQLAFTAANVRSDILIGGVPCTGASISGRAKGKLASAEAHPSAGAQFYAFLRMIEILNPAVCILENVVQYKNTASYAVICSVLKTLGYTVQERTLNGCEFGALESRDRMVMVAVSEGLGEFDIDTIVPIAEKPSTIAEVLDPSIDDSHERWKDYAYLREKESRDKAAGKGFMRNLLTDTAEKVSTITRDYNKVRSTDPQHQHPTNPLLTRLYTVEEHAKIKTIPARIVNNLSETIAHQIMGQSVIYVAFVAVGKAIAKWMKGLVEIRDEDRTPAFALSA